MLFGSNKKNPIKIADKGVREWRYATCGYCSTGCSIEVGLNADGEPVTSRGVADADVNRGKLCIKGIFEHELFRKTAGRGNRPLIRESRHEAFRETGWNEAIDLTSDEIRRIQDRYGRDAFADLRFMDALQHDYPYNATLFEIGKAPHKGDSDWEQEHTFSVPHSLRYPWLNLLTLNFGYHNAHHYDMNVPFYRLPALHEELTGNDPVRVIPFLSQLKLYHRNRVLRVCNPQPENYPRGEDYLATARTGRGPIGGNAASFLTSF